MSFVTGFTATLITWIWIILINDYSHQNGHHTASNICHLIKDLLQTLPCECRAFHVPHRPHLVGKAHFDATMIHSHFQQILIVPIYAFINLEFVIFHRCSQPLWQVVLPSPSSPDKPTIINVIGHTWKYTFSYYQYQHHDQSLCDQIVSHWLFPLWSKLLHNRHRVWKKV